MLRIKETTYKITNKNGRCFEVTLCTTTEQKFVDAYYRLERDYPESEGYTIEYKKQKYKTIE